MTYNNYRSILKKHLEDETLKDMGVSATDYSTHSFRRGGLSILADGEMHPSYIQNSAQHKRWDSSVTYIKPSLSKALRANNLLSGNNPEEGWGSRYSGNPRSLAPFLPKQSIKSLPSSMQVPQHSRPLVIVSKTLIQRVLLSL